MGKKWLVATLLACSFSTIVYANTDEGPAVTAKPAAYTAKEVFIPAQAVMQQYEVDLFYHYNSQMFLLMSGNNSVYFQVDQPIIYVNGQQVRTDVSAKYENHSLVIPARYLTEGLKVNVKPPQEAAKPTTANTSTITATASTTATTVTATTVTATTASTTTALFHEWQLFIPGVTWETHVNSGQGTVHVDATRMTGSLTIRENGTYTWISARDDKTIEGRWELTDSMEEPIMLLAGESGDDYRVGIYKRALYVKAKSSGWLLYLSGKLLP